MRVIGLMSGTSADGVDVALYEIEGAPPKLEARIVEAMRVPYDDALRKPILTACDPAESRVDAICRLNAAMGEVFAAAVKALADRADFDLASVDLIASHGQTIWHDVAAGGQVTSTLQVGAGGVIAERTGITTINDFRVRDVAAGGQGAPLTAYVDWLLLRRERGWRAVQNIGGMGNVTFLPPLDDANSPPLAFDTGPGNALIDGVVSLITHGELTYDRNGSLAGVGRVDEVWLDSLLAHPYFQRQPPKTTGREIFGMQMSQQLLDEGRARGLDHPAVVATLTALTAASIADAYRRFAPAPVAEVIIGGGGGSNPTLLRMLREMLAPAPVTLHEGIGLSSDFKEALVFAVLAYETWHNRPGTLPALTGAGHPTVLGQITPGDNYERLIRATWGSA
jgi:anhydro-N-acetylmuramic acid kinase